MAAIHPASVHAHGLTADDLARILATFPIFARKRPGFYAYLKERVDEWKQESSRAETSSTLHAVSVPHVQLAMAKSVEQSRSTTVSKPGPRKAPSQFQQAAILAWVVQQLYGQGRPVSRFRAGKIIYLIERAVQLGLFHNYLKQAAGPYDPSLRYKGPEDIAVRQQRWLTAVDESHFEPGPKINVALRYARRYLNFAQASAVIEQFRTYQDGTLSRWTTVDMAARELERLGQAVTPEHVWGYLADVSEWQHKLQREEFSVDLIASTLVGLRKIGFLGKGS
ncbi:MAG TPA: hypothetical protein VNK46_16185 [Nitrospiraceae bacterium]|nr:hypothetical protein [Nitrospiraceae bacterium]